MKTSIAEKDGIEGSSGHRAALFPALSEGSKEKRAVSILLACMEQVPELAQSLLHGQGAPLGKRSRLRAWTEAGPIGKKGADRPDGRSVTPGPSSSRPNTPVSLATCSNASSIGIWTDQGWGRVTVAEYSRSTWRLIRKGSSVRPISLIRRRARRCLGAASNRARTRTLVSKNTDRLSDRSHPRSAVRRSNARIRRTAARG